ncbi:hypothetical protein CVT25_006474 [Psilocybe cyanescens]|uniref:Uncharacterized protein n=1 Tax=Psilocybe cyanescens TaxID=93625 RepID=A0A409XEE1_PSICY|nr:hypothetical protein CVT25_006474 [Psilocybe cyanescens]
MIVASKFGRRLLWAIQQAAHVLLWPRLVRVLYRSPKPSQRILSRDTVDFVKDDAWTIRAGLRFEADEQIRQRYDFMLGDCPLPCLWGLSLLGTSLRVYCGEVVTGDVEPAFENCPSPGGIFPRNFLEGAWNIDILSQEGFAKMKEIVRDIVGNVTAS